MKSLDYWEGFKACAKALLSATLTEKAIQEITKCKSRVIYSDTMEANSRDYTDELCDNAGEILTSSCLEFDPTKKYIVTITEA